MPPELRDNKVRVVLDTNIVISGLLWGGTPRQLLELGRDGKVMLFSSRELLKELSDVLERDKFATLLGGVLNYSNQMTVATKDNMAM